MTLEKTAPVAVPPRRRRVGPIVALSVLLGATIASVMIGSNHVDPPDIWRALTAYDGSATDRIIVDLRIPRTAAVIVVGIGVGLAGALIQALTRNPLGDPGILGVNAGASLFVTVGVAFGAATPLDYLPLAFLGALVVTAAVGIIGSAGRGGPDPVRLTLSGAALSAVFLGITTGLTLLDPVTFAHLRSWTAGSVVERGWDVVLPVIPFVAVGVAIALAASRSLTMLGLGDDLARSLGTRPVLVGILSIAAITLLAGSATAVAGPIGFLGLAVPHVARWLVGPDQKRIFVLTMVLAPAFLLLSDIVARVVLWPAEVPVGVVTAFLGAPVLIVLVRRARASTL